MATEDFHEFHFVMGRSMKEELQDLDIYKGAENLSGLIVRILSLLKPVVKREHKWGDQRFARYMAVSEDPDEVREDVHVYFQENFYREIKLMHADLNFYSIAQMVRGFLEFFLDLVKEYGDRVFQEMEKLFKQWKAEDDSNRLTTREYIRQLWRIIQHLPAQNRLINIYGRKFSPFWILRL